MYEVYLITNRVNHKKYVGVTKRGYRCRFREHISSAKCGSNNLLHCAIRKYGESNFSVELIKSNVSTDDIGNVEQYYIEYYNSYYKNRCGYNMTIGGNGTIGYVFTDEVKKRMSKANSGRKYTTERNERIRVAMTGRYYPDEWRRALSAARLGKFTGENNSFFGKHHTEHTKKLIGSKNTKYTIEQYDKSTGCLVNTFSSAMDASRWVVDNGISTAKIETCNSRILFVCKYPDHCSAYGYIWKSIEKCID